MFLRLREGFLVPALTLKITINQRRGGNSFEDSKGKKQRAQLQNR